VALLGGILGSGCTDNPATPAVTGGSSEQGNALELAIADASGKAVAHAVVKVRPRDWTVGEPLVAGRFANTSTDAQGRVRIDSLHAGLYMVEAVRDSLLGAAPIKIDRLSDNQQASRISLTMATGSSLVLDGLAGADLVALAGLDLSPRTLDDGRIEFAPLPANRFDLVVRDTVPARIVTLPPFEPGSRAVATITNGGLQLDSGTVWNLPAARTAIPLLGAQMVELVPTGSVLSLERLDSQGQWSKMPGGSILADSSQGGWYRLSGNAATGAPAFLQWTIWDTPPGLLFGYEVGGSDSLAAPAMANHGARPLADADGSFLRMDSTQWVDFGVVLKDSIPQGSLEFQFRPGAGFSSSKAYLLVGMESSRLSVGYLKGSLFLLKSTDAIHRWTMTRPGQLTEDRWYTILASWGPQGMTISIDGRLEAWNADVTGYSPGIADTSTLHLVSGRKSSTCCTEALGLVSPLKLDGDIAGLRLRPRQPILWKTPSPHSCPDSTTGDLRARCGIATTPRIFVPTY